MTDLIEEAEAEAVNLERAGRPKAAALIRRMIAQMRQACAAGRMRFVAGQPTGLRTDQQRLNALELLNPEGETEWLSLDILQTCLGLSPKLVAGSAQNFKVTYPEDFALAQALLQSRQT